MSTLILDKTLSLFSEVISKLQLEITTSEQQTVRVEDNYWDSEYENTIEDHYSRYGF